jgi:hypothetical protein
MLMSEVAYPSVSEPMDPDEYPVLASETCSRCIGLLYAQLDWARQSVPEHAQDLLEVRLERALCYSEYARTTDMVEALTERAGIFAHLYRNHFARNFADTGSAFAAGSVVHADLSFCSRLLLHEELPRAGLLWQGCD